MQTIIPRFIQIALSYRVHNIKIDPLKEIATSFILKLSI